MEEDYLSYLSRLQYAGLGCVIAHYLREPPETALLIVGLFSIGIGVTASVIRYFQKRGASKL
jgi:hypothetical protein